MFTRPVVSLFPLALDTDRASAVVSAAAATVTAPVGAAVGRGVETAAKLAGKAVDTGSRAVGVAVSGGLLAVGLAAAAVGAMFYGRPEGDSDGEDAQAAHRAGSGKHGLRPLDASAAALAESQSADGSASDGDADAKAAASEALPEALLSPSGGGPGGRRGKHVRVPTTVGPYHSNCGCEYIVACANSSDNEWCTPDLLRHFVTASTSASNNLQWEGERAKRNELELDNAAAAVQSRVGVGMGAAAADVRAERKAVLGDVRVIEKALLSPTTAGVASPARSPTI